MMENMVVCGGGMNSSYFCCCSVDDFYLDDYNNGVFVFLGEGFCWFFVSVDFFYV